MKALIFLLMAVVSTGCAHAPVAGNVEHLFADELFPAPPEPVKGDDVFALSDSMRDYLAKQIAERLHTTSPQLGLLDALRDDIRIEYDSAMTRTAAQTFAARSGNCLSLVIMAAAFARQLGIPVHYQSVSGHDTWSRSGGIAFHSGHINLVLGSRLSGGSPVIDSDRPLIVDFLPSNTVARRYTWSIPEEMVVAMYMNNRAAETLIEEDAGRAYWLARAAIKAFPSFLAAYNTLGVIYLRHGAPLEAERVFNYVLEREPENIYVLSNLSQTFARQGRVAEARAMQKRLAEIAPYPPFYFLDEGLTAMERGDNSTAIKLFKKELARMPYADEVHFAIAMANLRMGEIRKARKHITLALENSTTHGQRDIYAAKLEYLKSLQAR